MSTPPPALFESFLPGAQGRSFRFDNLQRVLTATTQAEVLPLLAEVEQAVGRGQHAAGFVCYEAATGLDPALTTHARGSLPLAWFGLFAERTQVTAGTIHAEHSARILKQPPSWGEEAYATAFAAVKAYIAAGDSYQVNLTFRQHFRFAGAPFGLYRRLCAAQPAAFCAWLDLGEVAIATASPELFFARQGDSIVMRPMKGTAPRGSTPTDDRCRREELASSAKERAENLMIVDLVRNDLGRIAITGSVSVPELFCLESLPTLHQMTSTVTAKLKAGTGLAETFRALFPCGSVTGAPKRRSMEIIGELETAPRELYCGAIGFVSPDEQVFSVAIRTAILDLRQRVGTLGVGSGVTADAEPAAEFRECLQKAAFLAQQAEPQQFIETLRWHPDQGFLLLERHFARLAGSSRTLGFVYDRNHLCRQLQHSIAEQSSACKVRLLLAPDGTASIGVEPLPARRPATARGRVALAAGSIDPCEPLLYHKTTWRPWYDGVLEQHPGCLDVIFCNVHGEATEGTIHNLVVEKSGRLVTPPLSCGLLPGTLRQELLERGILREELISRAELLAATRLWLINWVRGWRRVTLD